MLNCKLSDPLFVICMAERGIIWSINCATECTVRMLVKLLVIIYHHAVMLQIYILWELIIKRKFGERESLLQYQSDMDPLENGWTLDDDGGFSIKWMRCNPAPDEVRIRQVFSIFRQYKW